MSDTTYTPNYDDADIAKQSKRVNISGRSPHDNVAIEEAAQRRAAENPQWQIARKMNHPNRGADSRNALEEMGLQVIG